MRAARESAMRAARESAMRAARESAMRAARESAMRAARSLLPALLFLLFAGRAQATVVGCEDLRHGRVWLRHCVNHGYYPRHRDATLPIEVEALEALRTGLVAAGRIEDRPILVEVPPWEGFTARDRATIAQSPRCEAAPDDGDTPPPTLGPCYLLDTTGLAPDWRTLRALTAGLTTLSPSRPERAITDIDALEKETNAASLGGITVLGPPSPSPDRSRTARHRFRDGRYDVIVIEKGAQQAHASSGSPFPGFAWSPRGDLAWATRDTVVAFDASGARRLDIAALFPGPLARHVIRLRFDGPDAIEIAADVDLLASYSVARWSLPVDAAAVIERDRSEPPW
jgi:hypothetical protein